MTVSTNPEREVTGALIPRSARTLGGFRKWTYGKE